jgi:hypothetical protein
MAIDKLGLLLLLGLLSIFAAIFGYSVAEGNIVEAIIGGIVYIVLLWFSVSEIIRASEVES